MPKNKKGKENEEVEVLDLETPESNTPFAEEKEEKENIFRRLKNKWDDLETRTKTIIIVVFLVLVVVAISTVLFIVLTKQAPKKTVKKEVIVAKDNYRYEDGTLYFVVNNKDIGSYECKNKNKNLCYVAYENNDDNFDQTQYKTTKEDKIRSKIVKNRYVFVFDNEDKNDENIMLYDIKNKKVLDTYKNIKTYDDMDNLVFALNADNEYGVLDLSGSKKDNKLDFDYEYLGVVTENKKANEDVIVAKEGNGYYLVDLTGKKLTSVLTGEIKNYTDKYVKTVDAAGKYMLYDYEGNKKAEGLNYIDLLDEYYLLVDNDLKALVEKIFNTLFTKYLQDLDNENKESIIYTSYLDNMSDEYLSNPHKRIVIDYLAGMTDEYILRQYNNLKENS